MFRWLVQPRPARCARQPSSSCWAARTITQGEVRSSRQVRGRNSFIGQELFVSGGRIWDNVWKTRKLLFRSAVTWSRKTVQSSGCFFPLKSILQLQKLDLAKDQCRRVQRGQPRDRCVKRREYHQYCGTPNHGPVSYWVGY